MANKPMDNIRYDKNLGAIMQNEKMVANVYVSDFDGQDMDYNGQRMVECVLACLNLEKPEEDIKKLVEALKKARTMITLANENPQGLIAGTLNPTIEYIDEALALWKGE